jgi:hypothetical protein
MGDVGHNLGTGLDALKAQAEHLAEAAGRLGEVTAETASRARDLQADGVRLLKEIEAARRAEKMPHEDAAKAVDARFRPVADVVERAKAAIGKALTDWMLAEERRRKAEEAEARRKADEARRAAEESAKAADPFDTFDAEQQAAAQAKAAEAASSAAREKVRVTSLETGAKAASLRTSYAVEVTDGPALVRHFAASPTLIEEARKIAAAQVRAAKGADCGIPGVLVREVKAAV